MGEGEGNEFPPKMEQSEAEIPAKKLARQLDFSTTTTKSVGLPENPQQPKSPAVQAVAQSTLRPQSPLKPQVPLQPQRQQAGGIPAPPSQPPIPPARLVKPESPMPRPRSSVDTKDGTPKKQKHCNCKHSRCLKLYCECFASGTYCDGCNCVNCFNNVDNEAARREAVEATLERNPSAFRPKIASSPHGPRDTREDAGEVLVLAKHNKGCHCKKSGCLKKYCECFQANILCSENCKCMDCKNFEGSEERRALFHGDHTNNLAFIQQQAANAAINGAVGSYGYTSLPLSKKRKGQELLFSATAKDQSLHRLGQLQQEHHAKSSAPLPTSPVPVGRVGVPSALGPSKLTYRSLLADIIQPQDLKELCSVLVVLSKESANIADENKSTEMRTENEAHNSLDSSNQDGLGKKEKPETKKAISDDCSTANQGEKNEPDDLCSDGADEPKGRPMSPGTLALMCDEQDTMFMTAASSNGLANHECNTFPHLPREQGMTEVDVEQERIILTKLRDCLNRIITLGEIKESKCSSLARMEYENHVDPISSNTAEAKPQTGREPVPPISSNVGETSSQTTARTLQAFTSVVSAPNSGTPKVTHVEDKVTIQKTE